MKQLKDLFLRKWAWSLLWQYQKCPMHGTLQIAKKSLTLLWNYSLKLPPPTSPPPWTHFSAGHFTEHCVTRANSCRESPSAKNASRPRQADAKHCLPKLSLPVLTCATGECTHSLVPSAYSCSAAVSNQVEPRKGGRLPPKPRRHLFLENLSLW